MSIYRPTIETLDDWNAAISACGCCEMPSCPVPTLECESAALKLCGFTPTDIGILAHPDVDERLILYSTCTVRSLLPDRSRHDS
jgi:hypothetical protein